MRESAAHEPDAPARGSSLARRAHGRIAHGHIDEYTLAKSKMAPCTVLRTSLKRQRRSFAGASGLCCRFPHGDIEGMRGDGLPRCVPSSPLRINRVCRRPLFRNGRSRNDPRTMSPSLYSQAHTGNIAVFRIAMVVRAPSPRTTETLNGVASTPLAVNPRRTPLQHPLQNLPAEPRAPTRRAGKFPLLYMQRLPVGER